MHETGQRRRLLLLHYAEIGLKGGNRSRFELRLRDRLREGLDAAGLSADVTYGGGRFFVRLPEGASEADHELALAVAVRIPGVANVSPALDVPSDLEALRGAAVEALAAAPPGTFKVESRRADKRYPLTSIQISQAVAPACAREGGRQANVRAPDVTVHVEVTGERAYVSAVRLPGAGGLPVGSTSRLLAFLSGGLDSPVAAWLMLRRGARVSAVHFHNRTHEGPAVLEKLEDLCGVLAWSCGRMPLLVVPFEACQRAIVAAVRPAWRMLVYRRAMFRIGDELARQEKALGFVTGDSLGQVASQTAENLRSVLAVARIPVYMPLVGSDKTEIVERARRIGTYEISNRPHADCCSFLAPPRPVTASRPEELETVEAGLAWDALVAEAVAGTRREVIRPDPAALSGAGPR